MLNGSSHSYEHVPDTFAYPLLPPHTLTIRRNHRTHARALRGIDFVRPVAGPSRPRQMEARKRRTGNNMDRPSSPKKPRTTDIDESPGSSRSGCEQDQHIPTHATHQHQHHHHRRASVPVDTAGPADSADRVRAETSRAAYAHHRESTGDSPDLDTLLDQTCPNERARSLAPSVDGYDSGLNTPARPQCVWKRRSGIENGLTGWPRAVGLWRRSLTTHSRDLESPLPHFPPAVDLQLTFAETDGITDVPAAFYAGTGIPTVLRLTIDRNSCIAHELRPQLHMTLTGALQLEYGERTIISVSVSLADGLSIWSRDAISAHRRLVPHVHGGGFDPEQGFPGGSYNLPLMVQVPDTRLPPSFESADGRFAIKYCLTATLSVDHPDRRNERIVLGMSHAPFTLLPTTLPDFPLTLQRVSNLSWHRCGMKWKGNPISKCAEMQEKWVFEPTLPCTTFSPSQVVPIQLKLTPSGVTSAKAKLFVRVGIKRRQHITNMGANYMGRTINDQEENIVSARIGVFEISGQNPTLISGIRLALSVGDVWPFGYSTHAGEVQHPGPLRNITASNEFYAFVQIGRLPDSLPHVEGSAPEIPLNRLLPLDTARFRDLNPHATQLSHCTLPITIGSVAEPRGAMHYHAWSDLSLEGGARLVEGGSFSSENGWLVPPPSYLKDAQPDAESGQIIITTLGEEGQVAYDSEVESDVDTEM